MGGTTDIKVRIKKCTNLEGNSMLPGWSSDPSAPAPCFTWPRAELRATDVPQRRYVIVKLCEKKEELEKFQTKTVSNCANPGRFPRNGYARVPATNFLCLCQ